MRTLARVFWLAALPVSLIGASADMASAQKRMVTVDLARTLLTINQSESSADEIARTNPFNPVRQAADSEARKPAAGQAVVMGDHELLLGIAATISPSGTIKLGDTQILLIGQKKLKVGDTIPIVFQGASYELQLSGIERTSYTLRLNKEEITRPIKPVNKP